MVLGNNLTSLKPNRISRSGGDGAWSSSNLVGPYVQATGRRKAGNAKAFSRLRIAAFLLAQTGVLGPVAAWSQTAPGRTIPDTILPEFEPIAPTIDLPEPTKRPNAAPVGAEAYFVRVGGLIIEDSRPELDQSTAKITSQVEGQRVSVARLYEIAAQVEALYAKSGFILTRVAVPPQEMQDGSDVRFQIVDGYIESVETSGLPKSLRSPVSSHLSTLEGERGLTLAQIERQIVLAGRVPGAALTTTLLPGSETGGTRLVVSGNHTMQSASLAIDNGLSSAYENWNFEGRVAINSALGRGEQIYGLFASASDFELFGKTPIRRLAAVGLTLPISDEGLSSRVEYLRSDTNPIPPKGGLPVAGEFERWSATLSYPLVLSRSETLELSGGFEIITEMQDAVGFATRLSEDRLRLGLLRLDWTRDLDTGTLVTSRAEIVQGLDVFGARNLQDAADSGILLSRQGTQPDFTKLAGAFSLERRLSRSLQGRFVLRGQGSMTGALPSSQQFALDGDESVSGIPLGSLGVDSGISARTEIVAPFAIDRSSVVAPYIFGALGTGSLSDPTALEPKHPNGWSIGGGVRALLAQRISLAAELSRASADILSRDRTQIHVRLGLQI